MISYNYLDYVHRLISISSFDMAQSMQVHVFPYIDRYKTIPGLQNRRRSDISLQKSRGGKGNYCFNSLSLVKRQILNMAR